MNLKDFIFQAIYGQRAQGAQQPPMEEPYVRSVPPGQPFGLEAMIGAATPDPAMSAPDIRPGVVSPEPVLPASPLAGSGVQRVPTPLTNKGFEPAPAPPTPQLATAPQAGAGVLASNNGPGFVRRQPIPEFVGPAQATNVNQVFSPLERNVFMGQNLPRVDRAVQAMARPIIPPIQNQQISSNVRQFPTQVPGGIRRSTPEERVMMFLTQGRKGDSPSADSPRPKLGGRK